MADAELHIIFKFQNCELLDDSCKVTYTWHNDYQEECIDYLAKQ